MIRMVLFTVAGLAFAGSAAWVMGTRSAKPHMWPGQ